MTNIHAQDETILRALAEDIGQGDITTVACVSADVQVTGRFVAKQSGLFCGGAVIARVFHLLDPSIGVTTHVSDGARVDVGDVLAVVAGSARGILSGERVALNFAQRLSGIATKTAGAVAAVSGTCTKICDTRKTTPGLRAFEKYAVTVGGGKNHRFGLYDGVLIKDNHIKAAGGIASAVSAARLSAPHTLRIEVETTTLAEVDEALAAGADIIMLDNMDVATMAEAVRRIDGRAVTEASGNMLDRALTDVAGTGVDYISIGGLTHSAVALDISLRFDG